MSDVKPVICCETFKRAFLEETDNEGCGSLLYIEDGECKTGNIGCFTELDPLGYCPWCGTKIEMKPKGDHNVE